MFKFPLLIVFAIVAFNITAFTVLLQMDWLSIQSPVAKVLGWAFTIAAWVVAYFNRNRFYTFRFR